MSLRSRLALWVALFVGTVALGVVLGLFADEVLGIHYRWGLGLGIAIGTGYGESLRERRRAAAKAPGTTR